VAREAEEERQRHAVEAQRRAAAAAQEQENRTAFRRVEEAALLRAQAMEEERRRAQAADEQMRAQAARAEDDRQERLRAAERERVAAESRRKSEEEARVRADADDRARAQQQERERQSVIPSVRETVPAGEAAYATAMNYAATAEPRFRAIRITRGHRYAVASAGAAVIAVLMAVGWAAMANRHPANPLGTGALIQQQNIDQQTPFGATTLKPASSSQQGATAPVQRASAQQKSTVRPATVTRQQKAAPAHSRHARRANDDVADDVVVRHFTNGKAQQTKTTAQAQHKPADGLKRISDLQ
jgi:dTMP kinase